MAGIFEDIQQRFKRGDVIVRLIFINVAVFIFMLLFKIIAPLVTGEISGQDYSGPYRWFALWTNDLGHLITHPWAIITHMFVHDFGLSHIGFNMLILYFMGRLFLNYFSQKQLLGLYLMGGLIGAGILMTLTFVSPFFKGSGPAFGASAAVMAIVIGIAAYAPNTQVRLFGIIPIEMKWVGLLYLASDILFFYESNTGGHIAHLGGAATGFWFANAFKQGKDITIWINRIITKLANLFKPKQKIRVEYSAQKVRKMSDADYNVMRKVSQEEIDRILDKISKSGYDSLTKSEKDDLFRFSNKK